jgi:hypothetical protein
MCDYILIVKICQTDLYKMYKDSHFISVWIFFEFMDVANKSCKITQYWVIDLNGGIELLTFYFIGQSHMVQSTNFLTKIHPKLIWEGFD